MSHYLSTLLGYVQLYKYPAIFVITYLGAIALPLPSGSVVMAAAAFSVQGYMSFWLVLITGILGNMAGDNSGYWLAKKYGIAVLHKVGLGRFFKEERLQHARGLLNKHPILTIYFSRFFTAIAPAVNVVAGVSQLDYKRYLLFEALGEITEVSCFAVAGFILGNNWEYFSGLSDKFWILIVAGMALSYMIWQIILKKSKHAN